MRIFDKMSHPCTSLRLFIHRNISFYIFSSFKKDGSLLNLLAFGIVLLGIITALSIYYIAAGRIEMPMIVGILSGAVTNTPGLGAAQEALRQLCEARQQVDIPEIALGYAVAYPLGVVGTILAILLIRAIFKIKLDKLLF